MQNNYSTDITLVLGKLCAEFQTIYKSKRITISFSTAEKKVLLTEPVVKLNTGLSKLLTSILDLVPDGNTLFAVIQIAENKKECIVTFRNTGINLKIVAGIFKKSLFPVTIYPGGEKETVFEVSFTLASNGADVAPNGSQPIPESPFNYISVLKGIRTYFSKIKNPVDLLSESNPKEGKFLQKVNAVISDKISDEQFDANALSTALSMSRAQLLRRLKKLTGLSPALYIKSIRLQKAKEMLEADVTVSDAAFENGFGTLSNFTKVFREKYGITPSQWRQTRPVQQINKK